MKFLNSLISIIFLLALVLGTGTSFAQTDYIITNNGAKIMGEVKSHNVDKVKFKAVGEEKTEKYKPEEIKEAYKAGHGIFRSVFIPKSKNTSFLQVLEDGKIKLYEYLKDGYTGLYGVPVMYGGGGNTAMGFGSMYSNFTRIWYAYKDGGDLVEIKSSQIWGSRQNRKDNFLKLLQDNAHVAERYQAEDKFNFDFVRSLIVEYNGAKLDWKN